MLVLCYIPNAWFIETRYICLAHAGLELSLSLPLLPMCWNYRYVAHATRGWKVTICLFVCLFCVCVCVWVWRSEKKLDILDYFLPLFFEADRSLTLKFISLARPARQELLSTPSSSHIHLPPALSLQVHYSMPAFFTHGCWCNPRSSQLYRRHFTNWAMSPSSQKLVF